MKLLIVDLETTGYDAEKDSIIEIAWVLCTPDGTIIEEEEHLIIPIKTPLNDIVERITHINNDMLEADGKPFNVALKRFYEVLQMDDIVVVGHNVAYDIAFLKAYNTALIEDKKVFDTHTMARILLFEEESYALEILAKKYNFTHNNAHRAMSDVYATRDMYMLLMQRLSYEKTFLLDFTAHNKPLQNNIYYTFMCDYTHYYTPLEPYISIQKPINTIDTHNIAPLKTDCTAYHTRLDNEFYQCLSDNINAYEGYKHIIITPRIGFLDDYKALPTASVLYSKERFDEYLSNLNDDTEGLFFALQIALRVHYNYRGKYFMNLYHHQYPLWERVCMLSTSDEYKDIMTIKLQEKVITITPKAFVELYKWIDYTTTIVHIDEAEETSWQLMNACLEDSIVDYNENAQLVFWVHDVVRTYIEPALEHSTTPFINTVNTHLYTFPQRLLDELESYNIHNYDAIKRVLKPLDDDIVWLSWNGQSDILSTVRYNKTLYDTIKTLISRCHTKIYMRSTNPMFLYFAYNISVNNIEKSACIVDNMYLPPLSSSTYTTEMMLDMCYNKSTTKRIIAYLGSSKRVEEMVIERRNWAYEHDIKLLGEKIDGGDTKVLELLKQHNKALLLTQKLYRKQLTEYNFDYVIIEKFTFSAPHPILEYYEKRATDNNYSWWDMWVMPQCTASLARKVSLWNDKSVVLFMDTRENAHWGKSILSTITGQKKIKRIL